MTPIRASMRVTCGVACALAVQLACGAGGAASATTEAELRQAIDSLRGIRYEGLTEAQKTDLGKKLDKAWTTLLADGAHAKPLVESALDAETRDGGFILDLCGLHLMLTKGASDPKRITAWMTRANPNDNPWRRPIPATAARSCSRQQSSGRWTSTSRSTRCGSIWPLG
jgi:hypothetical protein